MEDLPDKHNPLNILSDLLSRCRDLYDQFWSTVALFLKTMESTRAYELFVEHKNRIAFVLYMLWVAGCGYWFYRVAMLDVQPKSDFRIMLSDPRDALVVLFFGVLGITFLILFAFFLIKFAYNLFQGGIETLFSPKLHSIVKPASYLIILYFAFSFTGTIKIAGLTAYRQVADLVNKSSQHDLIIKKDISVDVEEKVSKLLRLMERNEGE